MLDETHQKGITTEIHCILDLTSIGIRCLKPIDDSSRYDVVADLNGKFIKEWECVEQAQKILKISNISTVCYGKRKHSGGYIWRYAND